MGNDNDIPFSFIRLAKRLNCGGATGRGQGIGMVSVSLPDGV